MTTIVPLVPSAAAATAPLAENLQNGSFEGAPGEGSGFVLSGDARTSVISRSGAQSVDLAPAGASPAAGSYALGVVRADPLAPLPLAQLDSMSFYYNVPSAPPTGMPYASFTFFFRADTILGERCLVHAFNAPLAQTTGWQLVTFDGDETFIDTPGDCDQGDATTLDGFASAFPEGTITALYLEVVGNAAPYPPAASVLVDDMSLRATWHPNVRFVADVGNLCDGAGFETIVAALACADNGASILVGPGTYVGDLNIQKTITLCSTTFMGASCDPNPDETIIRASGAYPVFVGAPVVTISGFTIEAPDSTVSDQDGWGRVDPTLVTVYADDFSLDNSILRANHAPLTPGKSLWATQAVYISSAGRDAYFSFVDIRDLVSAKNADGTCANAPCQTTGINAPSTTLHVHDLAVDGTGVVAPFTAVRAGGSSQIEQLDVLLPSASAGATDSIGLGGVIYGGTIGQSRFAAAPGAAPTGYGIFATFSQSSIVQNEFDALASGAFLRSGGPDNNVARNSFTNLANGMTSYSPATRIDNNTFSTILNAAVLLNDTAQGTVLRDNVFENAQTTLYLMSGVHDTPIDARENDWSRYTRAEIRETIRDAGTGNTVDVDCFIDDDGTTKVCPPVVNFSIRKEPAGNGRKFFFTCTASGQRPIEDRFITYGDGTGSSCGAWKSYRDNGTYTATLRVSDGEYEVYVPREVVAQNAVPELADVAAQTVDEDALLEVPISAADADGDAVTYTGVGLPAGASLVKVGGVTKLRWTPTSQQTGPATITIRASDGEAADEESFGVTVTDLARAPVLAPIGPKSVDEGATLSFTISATDADEDAITYSASNLPPGATFDAATATFTWTTDLRSAGVYSNVVFTASDGTLTDSESISISVGDVNQAPTLAPIGPKTVVAESLLTFGVSATDIDGDAVTIAATGLPAGATFDGSTFSWTPTSAGSATVTFTASDGSLTDAEEVVITVTRHNHAPLLADVLDVTADEGAAVTMAVSASDANGDALALSVTGLPAGASFVDNGDGTGAVSWTPGYDAAGAYALAFTVTDGELSATDAATLTIVNVDRAPTFAQIPDVLVREGDSATVAVAAADADGDAIVLSAGGVPAFATFTDDGDGTGSLAAAPTSGDAGAYTIVVTATANGQNATQTFTLRVITIAGLTLERVETGSVLASPLRTVTMNATITNTGLGTDTFALAATATRWTPTAASSVTLAPGESAVVMVSLTLPADAAGAVSTVTLRATSGTDPAATRAVSWLVDSTVTIDLAMDKATYLPFEDVTGTVTATFADGTPAAGLLARVGQASQSFGSMSSLIYVRTGASGVASFAFTDTNAKVPGAHRVSASIATASYASDSASYTIGL